MKLASIISRLKANRKTIGAAVTALLAVFGVADYSQDGQLGWSNPTISSGGSSSSGIFTSSTMIDALTLAYASSNRILFTGTSGLVSVSTTLTYAQVATSTVGIDSLLITGSSTFGNFGGFKSALVVRTPNDTGWSIIRQNWQASSTYADYLGQENPGKVGSTYFWFGEPSSTRAIYLSTNPQWTVGETDFNGKAIQPSSTYFGYNLVPYGTDLLDIGSATDTWRSIYASGTVTSKAYRGGYRAVTASTTLTATDYFINASTTAGALVLTLPSGSTASTGRMFIIKDGWGGSASSNIQVICSGGCLIDGQVTSTINFPYDVRSFITDGTSYFAF